MSDKNDIQPSPENNWHHDLALTAPATDLINMAPVSGKKQRPWNPDWFVYQLAASHHLPDTNQSLLVLGCENPQPAIRLAALGYDVQGIDSDPAAIDISREAACQHAVTGNCRFHLLTDERLDNLAQSFDVIVGIDYLQSDQLDTTLSQVQNVLKPGGIAIFKQQITNETQPASLPTQHGLTIEDLQTIRQTFDAVKIRRFTILSRLDHLIPSFSVSMRDTLQKLDHKLLTLCPPMSRFGAAAVITCHRHAQGLCDDIQFAA